MNKTIRLQLIKEAQEAFRVYTETTTEQKKDQADKRVVEYVSDVIKELPKSLLKPEIGVLASGAIILSWTKQCETAYHTAYLYVYDNGRMHLCMNCGDSAGHIHGFTVDRIKAVMQEIVALISPHFSV